MCKRRLNIDEYKVLRSIVGTPNMEKGHWFMAELIQFDTLEEPQNALVLDCDQAIEEMMHTILNTSK